MSSFIWLWAAGVSCGVLVLLIAARWPRFQQIGAELAAGILLASYPFLFVAQVAWPPLIVAAVVHAWLFVLPARLAMGRLEPEFLRPSTLLNALVGLLLVIVLVVAVLVHSSVLAVLNLALLLIASSVVSLLFLGQLLWNTRHYKMHLPAGDLGLKQLPTVSVCIPARNEDHALADCLQIVLASDYPKLEVLVLDDCSQDTTSDIIRAFAHNGVRFIQGDQPAQGWLGKNQAQRTLAQQASGDYLIFMDVDTHVEPQTISKLITYTLSNQLEMVSVLPQNRLGLSASTLFGTLDYFWRLALPISKRHLPISSKFWMVKATSLQHLGGFDSVSRKIVPEESFAHRLALRKAYRFLASSADVGVTTAKRWGSQIETSLRLDYPLLHRQPLLVLAVCAVVLGLFLAPFAVVIVCILAGWLGTIFWLAAAASLLLYINYFVVLARTHPHSWWLAGLLWPVVAVQEFVLFTFSMLNYEFAEVNWKGRNVCYPVLTPLPQQTGQERQAWYRRSQTGWRELPK